MANDSSTHYGKSYFDNRIRIHHDGDILNIHAIAIPMFERHTGENMFNLITTFFDIICPTWRTKLIGIGSDGENTMTGHLQGVVTRMEQAADHEIYRVWCGLHQLDLVMKRGYNGLMDGELVSILIALVTYLRAQPNLIADMRATCPKFSTRWIIMGTVARWLLEHRVRIFQHFTAESTKSTNVNPPSWWWVVIAGLSALTEYVNIVFIKLQSKDLLISQQASELQKLAADIFILFNVEGPFNEDEIANAKLQGLCCTYSRFRISYDNIIVFLYDQGMFIREVLDSLLDELHEKVICTVGDFILIVIDGIINIQAERDSRNRPTDDLPPVLPHELVRIRTGEFGIRVITKHLHQLRSSGWTDENIEQIERDHRALCLAYKVNLMFKLSIDRCDGNTSFQAGWQLVKDQYKSLRDFCGGIATVFANTATVESDFSILGWEKDEYRMSLTDLSLEGIMQCKQFKLLHSLCSYDDDLGFIM